MTTSKAAAMARAQLLRAIEAYGSEAQFIAKITSTLRGRKMLRLRGVLFLLQQDVRMAPCGTAFWIDGKTAAGWDVLETFGRKC
jgi:hypothetical protein